MLLQGNRTMQRVFPAPNDSKFLLQVTKGEGCYSTGSSQVNVITHLLPKSRLNVKRVLKPTA